MSLILTREQRGGLFANRTLSALFSLATLTALTALTTSFALTSLSGEAEAKKPLKNVHLVRYSYERQSRITPQGPQKSYVLMPHGVILRVEDYLDKKARLRALFEELKAAKRTNYGKVGFNTKEDDNVVLIFLDMSKSSNHPFLIAEAVYTFIEAGAKHVEFPKSPFAGRAFTKADVSYPAYQLTLPYWEGLPPRVLTGGLLSFSDGSLVTPKALVERLKGHDEALIAEMNASLKSADVAAVEAIVVALETLRAEGTESAQNPTAQEDPKKGKRSKKSKRSKKGKRSKKSKKSKRSKKSEQGSESAPFIFEELAPGLMSLLNSASVELRSLALRGLVGLQSPEVARRLFEVMNEDPNSDLQAKAAGLLSRSSDPIMAEKAQFFALRSSDDQAVIIAAEGLASAKSKDATTELFKVLNHKEEPVREAVIKALIARGAQTQLSERLKSELALVAKVNVDEALSAESNAQLKEIAYAFLVRHPSAEVSARAAASLAKESKFKPTLSLLTELLKHPEGEARLAAVKALIEVGEKGARDALATAEMSAEVSGRAAYDALRALYALDLKAALKDAGTQRDAQLKAAATSNLGRIFKSNKRNKKRAFGLTKRLATDSSPQLRGEAARAFGEMEDETAQEELMKLAQDEAVEVKRLVALALRHYSEESGRETLHARLKDDDAETLVNALESLAALRSVPSLDVVRNDTFLKHKEAAVRRAALSVFVAIAPELSVKSRAGLVARLEPMFKDSDLSVQLEVTRFMAVAPSQDSEFHLAAYMQSGAQALTLEIIKALAAHDTKGAVESLRTAVDIQDPEVREFTYQVGQNLKTEEAKAAFKLVLERGLERESDARLKALIKEELKRY